MLCRACRVHVRRDFPYCLHCGTLRKGATVTQHAAPQLRQPGSETGATPLTGPVTTIGREPGNDLVIDDASVSRHHARITRGDAGFVIEDLDSFNGTGVGDRTLHGERATLADSVLLHIGDVPLVFEQPRSAAIGSKTMVKGTEHTLLSTGSSDGDPAPTATEPLAVKPRRRGGWALKRVPDDRGRDVWVLRNTRTGSYLELDERDVFLWHRLDGQNSIRDLLFAYAQEYGELALPRIEQTLHAFASVDLVRGLRNQVPAAKPSLLRRFGRALVRGLLRMEVSIKGIDPFMGRVYRGFGWRFFTRTGVCLLWTLILAGLYGFWVARSHQRLFDVGGAGVWGAIIVGARLPGRPDGARGGTRARGEVVRANGHPRRVHGDDGDAVRLRRHQRHVVRQPLVATGRHPLRSTLDSRDRRRPVAGAAYLPDPVAAGICFQLAFGLYLNTLYNINPLMPLDGTRRCPTRCACPGCARRPWRTRRRACGGTSSPAGARHQATRARRVRPDGRGRHVPVPGAGHRGVAVPARRAGARAPPAADGHGGAGRPDRAADVPGLVPVRFAVVPAPRRCHHESTVESPVAVGA
jgi:putative peptide zinc metalloprotease protein